MDEAVNATYMQFLRSSQTDADTRSRGCSDVGWHHLLLLIITVATGVCPRRSPSVLSSTLVFSWRVSWRCISLPVLSDINLADSFGRSFP